MKIYRSVFLPIFLMAGNITAQTIDPCEWTMVFDENFYSLSLSANGPCGPNGTTWMAHTPYYGDFGCYMADPSVLAPNFPFTVEDDILRIEARLTGNDPCVTWGDGHSGILPTSDPKKKGFFQQYGYFECCTKLPPGQGTWPGGF